MIITYSSLHPIPASNSSAIQQKYNHLPSPSSFVFQTAALHLLLLVSLQFEVNGHDPHGQEEEGGDGHDLQCDEDHIFDLFTLLILPDLHHGCDDHVDEASGEAAGGLDQGPDHFLLAGAELVDDPLAGPEHVVEAADDDPLREDDHHELDVVHLHRGEQDQSANRHHRSRGQEDARVEEEPGPVGRVLVHLADQEGADEDGDHEDQRDLSGQLLVAVVEEVGRQPGDEVLVQRLVEAGQQEVVLHLRPSRTDPRVIVEFPHRDALPRRQVSMQVRVLDPLLPQHLHLLHHEEVVDHPQVPRQQHCQHEQRSVPRHPQPRYRHGHVHQSQYFAQVSSRKPARKHALIQVISVVPLHLFPQH